MARLLLLAALLVSVHAAVATRADYCYPFMGLPGRPLEGCREYVAQQTCGTGIIGAPPFPMSALKAQCCQELAKIQQHCRCEALRYFMGPKSHPDESIIMGLPGCPREPQRDFARTLVTPAECNVPTIHNTPFCLAMDE
uniref:Uncharacterized protein n=1 Tax=Avena sativa TaxID=4498 RepID=A0ACD5WRY4_AVESA